MAERWRPVKACRWFGIQAGIFEASDGGHARTVDRTLADGREAGGQVLEGTPDQDGYLRVMHGRRKLGVAVLVCLAWHGPPEVRHLNGNNQDNRPENLAWGSRRDNERDKWEQKRKEKEKRGTRPSAATTLPKTPVRLSQAVDLGILSGTLAAARKGSQRDPDFPVPVSMDGLTKLYCPADLARWEQVRRQL